MNAGVLYVWKTRFSGRPSRGRRPSPLGFHTARSGRIRLPVSNHGRVRAVLCHSGAAALLASRRREVQRGKVR